VIYYFDVFARLFKPGMVMQHDGLETCDSEMFWIQL